MDGAQLIENLVNASGLPASWAEERLAAMIIARGYNVETVTIEQVREILADLLQDLILHEMA